MIFPILFCLYLCYNTIITRPREAAIGTALILAGIPVYLLLRRKNMKQDQEIVN